MTPPYELASVEEIAQSYLLMQRIRLLIQDMLPMKERVALHGTTKAAAIVATMLKVPKDKFLEHMGACYDAVTGTTSEVEHALKTDN